MIRFLAERPSSRCRCSGFGCRVVFFLRSALLFVFFEFYELFVFSQSIKLLRVVIFSISKRKTKFENRYLDVFAFVFQPKDFFCDQLFESVFSCPIQTRHPFFLFCNLKIFFWRIILNIFVIDSNFTTILKLLFRNMRLIAK